MQERGATEAEVRFTVAQGEQTTAKYGRKAFQKTFRLMHLWKGKSYAAKQVRAIVAEEPERLVVISVIVSYIGPHR